MLTISTGFISELMVPVTGKFPVSSLAEAVENLNCSTYPLTRLAGRLEESVREDLRFLNAQPLIRQELIDNAKGYIWDIKTGKLTQIPLEGRTAL